jgi:Uma2 family endonuclease
LLAIEILAPEDRPLRVDRTIAEWLEFGVGYVWVVDPETLESVLCTAKGRVPVSDATLRIPVAGVEIPLRQLEVE